jgi:hypothetical protein
MNRRTIAGLLALPVAFSLGIALQKQYHRLVAQPVSVCMLTEHPSLYRMLRGDDLVTAKGFLYGGKVFSLAGPDVNDCNDSIVGLDLKEEDKPFSSDRIQGLFSALHRQTDDNKAPRVGVELVGWLNRNERDCFTSRYVIKVSSLRPISSLEVVELDNRAGKQDEER